jgi:hypothetical protein
MRPSTAVTRSVESSRRGVAVDERLMRRIEELPREVGWALVTAGVVGVIVPGILGTPFLVAGALVLSPGGPQAVSRWAFRKPRKSVHSALRQICRFLDDLERRYPRNPTARAAVVEVRLEYSGEFDGK